MWHHILHHFLKIWEISNFQNVLISSNSFRFSCFLKQFWRKNISLSYWIMFILVPMSPLLIMTVYSCVVASCDNVIPITYARYFYPIRTICLSYTHDIPILYARYAYPIRTIFLSYTHDMPILYARYLYPIHTIFLSHTHDIPILYPRYAYPTRTIFI